GVRVAATEIRRPRRVDSTRASWRRSVGDERTIFDSSDKARKTLERNPRSAPPEPDDESERARPMQTAGNLAVQRMLRAGVVRPKLDVSRPDDPLEREADEAAERAAAAAAAAACPAADRRALPAATPVAREILSSGGQALDASTRTSMEGFFGHDLGAVRVHTGSQADASARALRASAYTVGNEIVFREGEHRPGTAAGERLLAHELAHV